MAPHSGTSRISVGLPTVGGLLRLVILIVGLTAALLLSFTILEIPFAPWARSFGLWRTLTGEWQGELSTRNQHMSPVYLEIWHDLATGGCRDCTSRLDGLAKVCEGGGTVRTYDVSGRVDNWSGTKFHLELSTAIEDESHVGPGALRGVWDGDAMRATGDLVTRGRTPRQR